LLSKGYEGGKPLFFVNLKLRIVVEIQRVRAFFCVSRILTFIFCLLF